MPEVREIALAFPRGAHQELFTEGVLKYAREAERNWSYITAPESLSLSVIDLVGWPGDGILAAINTPEEARVAREMTVPVVNISSALVDTDIPTSIVDNRAIGRMAADHLVSKGFQQFAFYGLNDVRYSADRQAGFEERLADSGHTSVGFWSDPTFGLKGSGWLSQFDALAKWLATLPTPSGLLAVSDYRARQVLDACRQAGLDVPEKIAVVGVDNEQVICEHANPPLSSVGRNDELEGCRAAALLDRLMNGERVEDHDPPIAPTQVVERGSTATYAVSDPRLRAAMDYLFENLGDPITIDELTAHADVSRRWLEYAFRDAVGETPYQYLRRQRLAQAKRLLLKDRTIKINEIAKRTGFTSAKQLTTAFRQEYEMSPREMRRAHET